MWNSKLFTLESCRIENIGLLYVGQLYLPRSDVLSLTYTFHAMLRSDGLFGMNYSLFGGSPNYLAC